MELYPVLAQHVVESKFKVQSACTAFMNPIHAESNLPFLDSNKETPLVLQKKPRPSPLVRVIINIGKSCCFRRAIRHQALRSIDKLVEQATLVSKWDGSQMSVLPFQYNSEGGTR